MEQASGGAAISTQEYLAPPPHEPSPRTLSLLDSTPNGSMYYSELQQGIAHLRETPNSDDLMHIIHGRLAALYEQGKPLPEGFEAHTMEHCVVIEHTGFARIQDRFAELEPAKSNQGKLEEWSAERARNALDSYAKTKIEKRTANFRVNNTALESLKARAEAAYTDARDIPEYYRLKLAYLHAMALDTSNIYLHIDKHYLPIIVALPSHDDDEALWKEEFGFTDSQLNLIAKLFKIQEIGIIAASEHNRTDMASTHDYWAYAATMELQGKAPSMEAQLSERTGKHEGAHEFPDLVVAENLGIGSKHWGYEGWAGAYGDDGREHDPVPRWDTFVAHPTGKDLTGLAQADRNKYYSVATNGAGSRLYRCAYELIAKRMGKEDPASSSHDDVWSKIVEAMTEASGDIYAIRTMDEAQLAKLGIQLDEQAQELKDLYARNERMRGGATADAVTTALDLETKALTLYRMKLFKALGVTEQEVKDLYESDRWGSGFIFTEA